MPDMSRAIAPDAVALNSTGGQISMPAIDADAILLRRYRATGDRSAFEQLFRRYQAPIYGFVVRLIGPEDAYDLTQEIFLKALRSSGAFRGECTFRTWLYTIARNSCYNHCRDEKRRRAIEGFLRGSRGEREGDGGGGGEDELSQSDAIAQQVADPQADITRILETQELQRIVAAILETLTVEQRLLITLRDFEGMPYEEIGQIADLSLANVKSKLHRARLAFKTKFAPYWKALYGEDGESQCAGSD